MEWQEAELEVIRSVTQPGGEGVLERVKMMMISTHSTYIEHQILSLLCAAGWHLIVSLPFAESGLADHYELHASFVLGRVTKGPTDGAQVWVNPRHVDIEVEFAAPQAQGCMTMPFAYPIPMA